MLQCFHGAFHAVAKKHQCYEMLMIIGFCKECCLQWAKK
ncbi:Uncharacterized protein ChrSV_1731 [Chromobacterium vaccinii]|nr:Uncharacterized protein ChrSW_1731 [Chromobacterium vaccinii]QND89189.1 Uncharacterized protein ChrSV_1731 [Chromobacterium vaccinii]